MQLKCLSESIGDFKSAVAVPIKGNLYVLLGKSTLEDDRGSKWCFPGGGIHRGESAEAGAVRECREELGVNTDATSPPFYWPNDVSGITNPHVAFVIVSYTDGEIKTNHEFSDARWFTFNDALQLEDLYEPNRIVLERLAAFDPCPCRTLEARRP